jgi:hypothetical protein
MAEIDEESPARCRGSLEGTREEERPMDADLNVFRRRKKWEREQSASRIFYI